MRVTVATVALLLAQGVVDAYVPAGKPGVTKVIASRSPLFAATPKISEGTSNDDVSVKDDVSEEVIQIEKDIATIVNAEADLAAELAVQSIVDDECDVDDVGMPVDEVCVDETERVGIRNRLKSMIGSTMNSLSSDDDDDEDFDEDISEGEILEKGWEKRGSSSSIRRNAEVWKFALKSVFRCLKPRKMRKKGASEEEIETAQVEAAMFIRDGLLTLGPSFVKLGQVAATRTDVLPKTYIDILKTLQDEVPGFSGKRAKEIVSEELGVKCDKIFKNFSKEPLKAASLGQVHTADYKGQKVAIKVQRAGLKELFDGDLKNLRKLAELLDKFDPKSDGADRDWVSIYDESERLLYLEIDYLNEADNCERFAQDFKEVDWVRVPRIFREVTTPRVLTMEFVESLKLTDIEQVEELGLDKELLAQRAADAFLRQIVETSVRIWNSLFFGANSFVCSSRCLVLSCRPSPRKPLRRHERKPRLL